MLQGLALEQLHRNERLAVLFADFVDGADVRMVQRGSSLRLTPKAFESCGSCAMSSGRNLSATDATEAVVFGFIDHTHPAAAEFFQDAVVRNGLADQGVCA